MTLFALKKHIFCIQKVPKRDYICTKWPFRPQKASFLPPKSAIKRNYIVALNDLFALKKHLFCLQKVPKRYYICTKWPFRPQKTYSLPPKSAIKRIL